MAAAPSQVRQNYHPVCEATVTAQIQLQLYASYVYLSMAFYCDRDDVALGNFARFFLRQSHEWKARAEKLLFVQNQRGGRICLGDVAKPDRDDWLSGLQAMECAFHLEMTKSILELYRLATDKGDLHLCDFLRNHYLCQQVETLEDMYGYLTDLRQDVGTGRRLGRVPL
jgi:ferritin heavy chain